MPTATDMQNLTLRWSKQTIHKARVLAAKRATSISNLLAEQIERLATDEDEYDRAMRSAIERMDRGFHLGGDHQIDRDALHERR